jgi:hypothetical protein
MFILLARLHGQYQQPPRGFARFHVRGAFPSVKKAGAELTAQAEVLIAGCPGCGRPHVVPVRAMVPVRPVVCSARDYPGGYGLAGAVWAL